MSPGGDAIMAIGVDSRPPSALKEAIAQVRLGLARKLKSWPTLQLTWQTRQAEMSQLPLSIHDLLF